MKKLILAAFISLLSFGAYAEGPILQCEATREGPRSDGKLGYELIDKATINTVIDEKIETTQMKDLVVKTYVSGDNRYLLVLSDTNLEISSTQMGTLGNEFINLSLSGKGYSNFIKCDVL
jgi:hypothetical protein